MSSIQKITYLTDPRSVVPVNKAQDDSVIKSPVAVNTDIKPTASSGSQPAVKALPVVKLPFLRRILSRPQYYTKTASTQSPVLNAAKCHQFIKADNLIRSDKLVITPKRAKSQNNEQFLTEDPWAIDTCTFQYDQTKNIRNFKAVYKHKDGPRETRTMKNLINMIGVERFDKVIAALWTISDSDLKANALTALLTPERSFKEAATSTYPLPVVTEKKRNARVRRRQQPYVLNQDEKTITIVKTVIDPHVNSQLVNKNVKIGESGMVEQENQKISKEITEPQNNNPRENEDEMDRISLRSSLSRLITRSLLNDPQKNLHGLIEEVTDGGCCISGLNLTANKVSINSQDNKSIDRSLKRANPSVVDAINKRLCIEKNTENTNLLPKSKDSQSLSDDNRSNITQEFLNRPQQSFNKEAYTQADSGNLFDFPPEIGNLLRGVKPEDIFNLLTKERLQSLPPEDQQKLKQFQMYIDWKYCLVPDEDNNLPIHNAVLNKDCDLLMRQCLILKACNQSVDIGDANFNYSALQMCIVHGGRTDLMRVLLQHGASPLELDDEERSALHLAAEAPSHEELEILLQHMAERARHYLQEENQWSDEMEKCSDKELTDALFTYAIRMFDNSGCTPLMQASKLGHGEHVMLLLEQIVDAAHVANQTETTSGNTALYLAVEAACHTAQKLGDMSKVPDNYARTIENLIRYGADPWINNKYNSSIQILVQEFNFRSMNSLIMESINKNKFRNVNIKVFESLPNSRKLIQKSLELEGHDMPFMIIKTETGVDIVDPKARIKREKKKIIEKPVHEVKYENLEEYESKDNLKISSEEIKFLDPSALMLIKSPTGKIDVVNPKARMRRIDAGKTKKEFTNEVAIALKSTLTRQSKTTKSNAINYANETDPTKISKSRNFNTKGQIHQRPLALSTEKDDQMINTDLKTQGLLMKNLSNIAVCRGGTSPQMINNNTDSTLKVQSTSTVKPLVLKNLKITNSSDLIQHINVKQLKLKVLKVEKPDLNSKGQTNTTAKTIVLNRTVPPENETNMELVNEKLSFKDG